MVPLFSGCALDDFADIPSAMSPPFLTSEQYEIEKTVREHLGENFKWLYPFVDGKYTSSLECDLSGKNYVIVFCQTDDEYLKSHILFLENNQGKLVVTDDLVEGDFEIKNVSAQDVNNDGISEIVFEGFDSGSFILKRYIYQIRDNKILQIKN